ncbi:MAG: MFS transporter, partial [Bacilli bacterium]|nr:MFS transporter [Bacilli bacterium]
GALGNALAVVLMFLIRPGQMVDGVWVANGWAYVGCMIAFYILWDTFFTMNDIGYWAMLPSLTNDETERAHLTSRVTICAAIGAFIMTLGATFLPTMFTSAGVGAGTVYGIMAIAVSILFLVSQAAVFFFCQEKRRDLEQEEKSEKTGFLDLFKVIGKNGEVRAAVIGIFLYQLASTLITGGVGLNYFYLAMGYGSFAGGLVVSLISIFYVFAMLGSQALYPIIAKKISKRKILLIGFIVAMVGALGFFTTCFPVFGDQIIATSLSEAPRSCTIENMDFGWAFGGLMFLNYLFPFSFFFGCGLIYMVILVMFQDSIDYNEWKYGDRKESIISAWRPLDVKLAGAALRGLQFVIFASAGVLAYLNDISTWEGNFNSGAMTADNFHASIDDIIFNKVTVQSLRTIGIWVAILFILCLSVMFYFLRFQYKTTEEEHRKIVAELAERHAAAEAKEDAELAQKESEEEIQAEEEVKAKEQAVSEPEQSSDEEKPE